MISLASRLRAIENRDAFPPVGREISRWGQLLRQPAEFSALLRAAQEKGRLVPLARLGNLFGGVVTRANGYFLLRELMPDSIPARFKVTHRDLSRIAVLMDGKQTAHKIERRFLRHVIKGPEMLLGPTFVSSSDLRLFCIDLSPEELRAQRFRGAYSYMRRGETENYRLSEDSLKGGIPATRSNIKNRSPYWYSLNVPPVKGPRIVVPEHYDDRYVATLVPIHNQAVVLDKLFVFEPDKAEWSQLLLGGLNSLLTWCQLELRGRTQLGQGVLEVKKADLEGVLVLNPEILSDQEAASLLESFRPLAERETGKASVEVVTTEHLRFDVTYAGLAGNLRAPREARIIMERTWRNASQERSERASSLDVERAERGKLQRVSIDVDAWAARIAAALHPFPDPRELAKGMVDYVEVYIEGPIDGPLRIGKDLFSVGQVFSGNRVVASAGDMLGALYLQSSLTRQPNLKSILLPDEPFLGAIMAIWEERVKEWNRRFEAKVIEVCAIISDERTKREIADRARILLHALDL